MHSHSTSRTGSVLITAVIFGFALFAAVSSYVYLTTQSMKLANRTFHLNSAMNLAEAGIEEALYALNKFQGETGTTKDYSAWDNWTGPGDYDGDGFAIDKKRTFSNFSSNQGTQGEFTVIVTNWDLVNEKNDPPKIIVRASSAVANSGVIEKYVRATTSRRSLFKNSFTAKEDITFSGNNVSVFSYNPELGPFEPDLSPFGFKEPAENVTGPAGVPDFDTNGLPIVNRFSNVTVASASVDVDSVNLGNADVWGAVATGGDQPDVGPNGTISEIPAAPGTVDPDNVSTDFQANFPPPPAIPGAIDYTWSALPTASGGDWTLYDRNSGPTPTGVTLSGNAKHYYLGTVPTVANPDPVRIKITSSITMGSNDMIFIQGPVILELDADFSSAGNSGIQIRPMDILFNLDPTSGQPLSLKGAVAPLRVWVAGDFTLTGNGLTNPYTISSAVQIYGTAPAPVPPSTTGTQTFDIKGNGDTAATVYAPNADLTVVGNGQFFGAFVANSIVATGNAVFVYDESLGKDGTGKFSIALWRELVPAAERTGYLFD